MTHSIDTPLPPPAAGSSSTTDRTRQTKDVAASEAQNVKDSAVQAGSQVAATAADQAKEVVQETQRQAKDLVDQGRSQLREQAISQQQKAGQTLNSLAKELRGLADGSSQGAPGPARDLLQQASGLVDDFAHKLQTRDPGELLDEVRRFARRKPGLFLLGAATAGIVAGRLTSGVRAGHTDSSGSMRRDTGAGPNYVVDPGPAYVEEVYVEGTYEGVPDTTGTGVMPPATSTTSAGAPLPPPPYGTVPPPGSMVPPASPAGWEDPARRPGGVA